MARIVKLNVDDLLKPGLSAQHLGIYMMLVSRAVKDGGLPVGRRSLAALAGVTAAEFESFAAKAKNLFYIDGDRLYVTLLTPKPKKNSPVAVSRAQVLEIAQAWSDTLPTLAKPRVIDDDRVAAIRARWYDAPKKGETDPVKWFRSLFEYLRDKCGVMVKTGFAYPDGRVWRPSFDFIISPAGFRKTIDGNYEDKS